MLGRLRELHGELDVVTRDLTTGIPIVDNDWVEAAFTPPSERTPDQSRGLELSDVLLAELKRADILVAALPIYNFTVPASFKLWIDQIVRKYEAFAYVDGVPTPLLRDRPAYVAVASGGTKLGASNDFLSPYVRYVLGFVGIKDVTIIGADETMRNRDASVEQALRAIRALSADR